MIVPPTWVQYRHSFLSHRLILCYRPTVRDFGKIATCYSTGSYKVKVNF